VLEGKECRQLASRNGASLVSTLQRPETKTELVIMGLLSDFDGRISFSLLHIKFIFIPVKRRPELNIFTIAILTTGRRSHYVSALSLS
jgi:hypothetical protein